MKLAASNPMAVFVVVLSSLAAFAQGAAVAQMIDPATATKLTQETWQAHGLSGLLTLALLLLMGVFAFIAQRFVKMLERTVSALVMISDSHRALVDALKDLPCVAARHHTQKQDTPSPFQNMKSIGTTIDTPL